MLLLICTIAAITIFVLLQTSWTTSTSTEDNDNGSMPFPPDTQNGGAEVRILASTKAGSTTILPEMGIGPEMLICTYGRKTQSDEVMAADGLCDIAFYDSIYGGDRNNLSGGNPFESDLVTFMNAADRYSSTTLGVSFAFQYTDRLGNDLRMADPNPLQVFWQKRIYHTGILDTPTDATRIQMQTAMARLKVLAGIAEMQRAMGNRAFTALSAPSPSRAWIHFFEEEFSRLNFIPDFVVLYGHYPFGDNTVDNCAVMPPTRLSLVALPPEFRGSYQYDLSYGPHGVREWQNRQLPTHALVSITMKGRWTTASSGQPWEFFARCVRNRNAESFGSYTEVCRARNYEANLRYHPDHFSMLTCHIASRRLFAYDDEVGMAAKLCKVKDETLDVTFSIAAYDVDYDDYANECAGITKFGMHSRLKALRNITNYFRRLAGQIFDQSLCTKAVV